MQSAARAAAGLARRRRSVLYMPASKTRLLEKAAGLDADALILDLEDAVGPAHKAQAREQAVEAAQRNRREGTYGRREVVIRVNGADTEWHAADVAAVASAGADAVLLPKAESGAQVRALEAALAAAGAPESLQLWAMVETPRGVLSADDIAGASPRLACLVMGTVDLCNDLHARPDPGAAGRANISLALQQCVLAARANGVAALDGVYVDLEDDDGFARECAEGRDLGFDGKTLIHPKTIDVANAAFGPSPAQVDHARAVIAMHATHGGGVFTLNGKLVEDLHVRDAHRILALALD